MTEEERKPYYLMQTVERALFVLDEFMQAEKALSISELSAKLRLHKSIIHRLVATMCYYGFLEKEETSELYQIGPNAFRLGTAYMTTTNISEASRLVLSHVADQVGFTVNVATLERGLVNSLLKQDPVGMATLFSPLGTKDMIHCTALGKCLVAWHQEDQILAILKAEGMPLRTVKTILKPGQYLKELVHVRQNGYALDMEESRIGFCCIGAPIFDYTGLVVASLSFSGMTVHEMENKREELSSQLLAYAGEISRKLGHLPTTQIESK